MRTTPATRSARRWSAIIVLALVAAAFVGHGGPHGWAAPLAVAAAQDPTADDDEQWVQRTVNVVICGIDIACTDIETITRALRECLGATYIAGLEKSISRSAREDYGLAARSGGHSSLGAIEARVEAVVQAEADRLRAAGGGELEAGFRAGLRPCM